MLFTSAAGAELATRDAVPSAKEIPMERFRTYLGTALGLSILAIVINLLGAGNVVAQAVRDVIVINRPSQPVPTAVQSLPAITGAVSITNTPTVNVARTLVNDGRSFSLSPDPNIAFELSVPPDTVLTDVVLSLNNQSVATTVFVADAGSSKTYLFETVGSPASTVASNTTGRSAIHLQSGIHSAFGLRVGLYCNNVGGNSCSGALMWSGYQP
jgi:hypothetical protein